MPTVANVLTVIQAIAWNELEVDLDLVGPSRDARSPSEAFPGFSSTLDSSRSCICGDLGCRLFTL